MVERRRTTEKIFAAADDVRDVVSRMFVDDARRTRWEDPAACSILSQLRSRRPELRLPPDLGASPGALPIYNDSSSASLRSMLGVGP